MGLFSFMETSFFFTLGITFLLILLLVYHFKQRIANAESKQDTMFEIINNLVQEVSKTQQTISLMNRPRTPYPEPLYSNFHIEEVQPNMIPITEAEAEDDVSEINEYDLEDSDDEIEVESDDDNSMGELSIIEIVQIDPVTQVIDNDEDQGEVTEGEVTEGEVTKDKDTTTELTQPDFNKMNLGGLKTYILEQGWVEDASKMKKAQILSLIQEHSA